MFTPLEYLGVLYGPLKDALAGLGKTEDKIKTVDIQWPVYSGAQEQAKQQGWELAWVHPAKEQRRTFEGYQVWYEYEKGGRITHRLVLTDGLVLMGKRIQADAAR